MNISTTKLLIASFTLIMVLGGVGYTHPRWFGLYSTPRIHTIHPLWETDFRDNRKLVGIANNVFVGKVISSNGTVLRPTSGPVSLEETTFNVEVLQNIKGQLRNTIVVNQMGSFDERTNTYNLMEGDQLLQPGMTYLFVTNASKNKDWHTFISKYGNIPLVNEEEKQRIVKEFVEAYRNEIRHVMEDGTKIGESYIQQ